MTTEIVPQAAQGGIHNAIRVNTDAPPAVVFNEAADIPSLLSYAHGQLVILTEVLLALGHLDEPGELPYALRSIVEPAITAIEIASTKAGAAA